MPLSSPGIFRSITSVFLLPMHITNQTNPPLFQPNSIIPTIHIEKDRIDTDVSTTPTDTTTTSTADINKTRGRLNSPVTITIDINPPTPEDRAQRPRDLIIPTLIVEHPSPTREVRQRLPPVMQPGSPPPQRASIGETSFAFPNKEQQKR